MRKDSISPVMIRQACITDVSAIEDIFLDVIEWMHRESLENQWNESNTRWSELAKNYKISDFYLCFIGENAVGCVAVTDKDKDYWPEIKAGDAWFLHKLAVKRAYAGQHLASELITYVCEEAEKNSIPSVRLDCNHERSKLKELYEKEGFVYCRSVQKQSGYQLALYCKKIADK